MRRINHGVPRRREDTGIRTYYLGTHRFPSRYARLLEREALRRSNHIGKHNILDLLDAGLCVTINLRDPTYSAAI